MNITLIGGSGFVGTRLIQSYKDSHTQHTIKNIDLEHSHFFDDLTVIGDVRDIGRMKEELRGTDVVVLLAAQHRDDVTPRSLYYDTNVGGMRTTLKAMESNGIHNIIFISSLPVYVQTKPNPHQT